MINLLPNYMYSQLSPCGHPAITDTPLLRTVCKSPAETTMKCIEITFAITDSRYYGIADTSCGPQQTFLLFVTTDTLDVFFSGHNMEVNDFLIDTVTYFTVSIYQRKYFEDSVRHHFCRQN